MITKTFYAAQAGFIDGSWRELGEAVSMTEAQAKYHLLDGRLLANAPVKKESSDETTRKTK